MFFTHLECSRPCGAPILIRAGVLICADVALRCLPATISTPHAAGHVLR